MRIWPRTCSKLSKEYLQSHEGAIRLLESREQYKKLTEEVAYLERRQDKDEILIGDLKQQIEQLKNIENIIKVESLNSHECKWTLNTHCW